MKNSAKFFALCAAMLATASYAAAEDEVWTKITLEAKLHDRVALKLEEENKFSEDRNICESTLLMLNIKIANWISLGLGDSIIQERKEKAVYTKTGLLQRDHYWQQEHRPTGDISISQDIKGWRIDMRNRFELRDKDDGSDAYLRYRNRLRLRTPYKWTQYAISPFASWEMFIEDKDGLEGSDRFNQCRTQIGLSAKITDNVSSSVYYTLEHDKSDNTWTPTNIFGIELNFNF